MFDVILFAAFPYLAVAMAVVVGIYRYRTDQFSYSSFSSQFLESRSLFWGSVAWHYTLLTVLSAHVLAFCFPATWGALIGDPTRRWVLETLGLALGWLATFAMGALLWRRSQNRRVAAVTTKMDWVLLVVLFAQVALGSWIALSFRWGSEWSLHTAMPWLYSLLRFSPDLATIAPLPWTIKAHFIGAFAIILLFPFTRLVHVVTIPFAYLWRPYQVVIWNRRPARDA